MKKNKEKITRKKITRFSYTSTPIIFKVHNNIIFLFTLNNLKFKSYRNTTLSSTNHLRTLIATKQYTKKFLGVGELWGTITFSF
jgi:hypothetical protein